jgi:hypothetical protein
MNNIPQMHPASGEYCSPPLGGLIVLGEYSFMPRIGFGDNSLPKYLNLSEWLPHGKRYSPFSKYLFPLLGPGRLYSFDNIDRDDLLLHRPAPKCRKSHMIV